VIPLQRDFLGLGYNGRAFLNFWSMNMADKITALTMTSSPRQYA
jgi:hypothetical protein